MRVGFIVDGDAEFASLHHLYPRLESPHTLLKPIRGQIQPWAKPRQVAAVAAPLVSLLSGKGVDLAIVLMDWERLGGCPGEHAQECARLIHSALPASVPTRAAVVVKVRTYENWLVSDPSVFRSLKKRFQLSATDYRRIAPGKGDSIDALALIKKAATGDAFEKVTDAIPITKLAVPSRMAENSRSFRKFLNLIEHPAYRAQSKLPR